jgi:hypothetical protein
MIKFTAISVERFFGNTGYKLEAFFVTELLPFFMNKTATAEKNDILSKNLSIRRYFL